MNEDYPDTAAVATVLKEKIEDFMQHLPLIKCFTSEAITDEDWGYIKTAIGQEQFERDEVTVEKMVQLDLHVHLEIIEEITMKAEKKLSLSKKLKQMKEEMKLFTISYIDYKGKTQVINNYDDINAKLDDLIVNTQAMLGSAYTTGRLKTDTKGWENRLSYMSELIEEIKKC